MTHFIQGIDRQLTATAVKLDDLVAPDSPVHAIDAFVDSLDLAKLGFKCQPAPAQGYPPYHPADLLKLLIYGYLNRIQSCRRLEQEAQRNVEVMWLIRLLQPNFKTINNFTRLYAVEIRKVSHQFVKYYGQRACLPAHPLPSMAASSKRITTAIKTTHRKS